MSSVDFSRFDTLLRSLVLNAVRAGAEATTFMLAELTAKARTPEAIKAVREADAAWLVFNQAFNTAVKAVRDSCEVTRDS